MSEINSINWITKYLRHTVFQLRRPSTCLFTEPKLVLQGAAADKVWTLNKHLTGRRWCKGLFLLITYK